MSPIARLPSADVLMSHAPVQVLEHLPTTALAGLPLAGAAFVPPVSVEKLARIAALAVTDSSMPPGVLDPWQLQKFDD